jgi:rhodanese-related sulfurtransferase
MNEIPERLDELDKSKMIIVQCKSGKRSARVCEFLQDNNFMNVKNLTGGILAWAKEIDPSITVF